jgi:formamidopyrimidine-DNA glycosylase
MPELPEVETTIKGLKPLIGSFIINTKIHTPKLRYFIPKNITKINQNIKIDKIKRIGKFIIISLSSNYSIVMHLGMSGRLRLYDTNKYKRIKHDHFILKTNNEHLVVFNDARRFGFIDYDYTHKILQRSYVLKLGKDALDCALSGSYLRSKISNKLVPIKQILLDQTILAGIGNIYASEILFNAKISPLELGKDLSLTQCNKLILSVKKILKKAIYEGGSTLRDYVSTDGTLGNFQNKFKVYTKDGVKINGKLIYKIVQYGRATYYCPEIQKKNRK